MPQQFTIHQSIQIAEKTLPIYIVGAGGIVRDAHLPAYKKAGFYVAGIYDVDVEKASALAAQFAVPKVFKTIGEMCLAAGTACVYDVAVPANKLMAVLQQLPAGCNVLMQKPMGENLADAKAIVAFTEASQMKAAVNFQLRYAPYINAARSIIGQGLIGDIYDIMININVYTPWHLWSFLFQSPRVEILYHSIHYIDLIRSFLGNPSGMFARTFKHPVMQELSSVRSDILMDYGHEVRAVIHTNHTHNYGLHNQHSYIKIEGEKGAIKINIGSLMNYPAGVDDAFEYIIKKNTDTNEWQQVALEGSWFPDAFIGSMNELMLAANGSKIRPGNAVQDALFTMACVEAAYESDKRASVPLAIG